MSYTIENLDELMAQIATVIEEEVPDGGDFDDSLYPVTPNEGDRFAFRLIPDADGHFFGIASKWNPYGFNGAPPVQKLKGRMLLRGMIEHVDSYAAKKRRDQSTKQLVPAPERELPNKVGRIVYVDLPSFKNAEAFNNFLNGLKQSHLALVKQIQKKDAGAEIEWEAPFDPTVGWSFIIEYGQKGEARFIFDLETQEQTQRELTADELASDTRTVAEFSKQMTEYAQKSLSSYQKSLMAGNDDDTVEETVQTKSNDIQSRLEAARLAAEQNS